MPVLLGQNSKTKQNFIIITTKLTKSIHKASDVNKQKNGWAIESIN